MKKLLTVAVNEYNVAPLRGCVNDSNNVKDLCVRIGYEVTQLLDEEATKQNIIEALTAIGKELKSGDKLMFHYSGHGSQIPTIDPTETDNLTEILCPFDLILPNGAWTDNFITDDELNYIFSQYDSNVEIECILDCCHSGTGTRDIRPHTANRFVKAFDLTTEFKIEKFDLTKSRYIICWSGCRDDQTSADAYIDGMYQGAFTSALLKTEGCRRLRYTKILELMQKYNFSQVPQLTCNEKDIEESMF
jgi:uncharacterized caspase-like protein